MGNKSLVPGKFVALGLALLFLGWFGSCQAPLVQSGGSGSVRLALNVPSYASSKSLIQASGSSARYIPTSADRAVIVISAPDMTEIVKKVDNLPGLNPKSVQIDGIPIGHGRTITVTIYNAADTILSVGTVTLTIRAGLNQTQAITALPNVPPANQLKPGTNNFSIPANSVTGDYFYSLNMNPGLYDCYVNLSGSALSWLTVIDGNGVPISASRDNFDGNHAAFSVKEPSTYYFAISVPYKLTTAATVYLTPQARSITPSDLSAGVLTLTWPDVKGSTGYNVYQSTANDPGSASLLAQTTASSCKTGQLAKHAIYYFWVKAIDSNGKPSNFLAFGASGDLTVGDKGPGGGIVFYIYDNYSPGWHYLESAPPGWNGGISDPVVEWSNITNVSVSTTIYVGSGFSNSQNIVNQPGHASSAAQLCRSYNGNGFNNWYLPSRQELLAMLSPAITGPAKIDTTSYAFWSSSEYDSGQAYFVSSETNYDGNKKAYSFQVRPIRQF